MGNSDEFDARWRSVQDFAAVFLAGGGSSDPQGGSRADFQTPPREDLCLSGLSQVYDRFQETRSRFLQFGHWPLRMFWHGLRVHHLNTEVCFQMTGRHVPPPLGPVTPEGTPNVDLYVAMNQALFDWIAGRRSVPEWHQIRNSGNVKQAASIASIETSQEVRTA